MKKNPEDELLESVISPRPTKPEVGRDRFTGSLQFHHETHGELPYSNTLRFSWVLDGSHQAVQRSLTIEGRAKLDCQWIPSAEAGLLIVQNRAGQIYTIKPTPEQLQQDLAKTIEVYCKNELLGYLRPGVPLMLEFDCIDDISLQTTAGPTPILYCILPR